ncbi:MAG TPA: tryptophan synthase subunit alpha [Candidatus Acidoferrales bacterium]|nr:tryptophan synthase subunit alpha [Candidatus Acidoferrales bacterium]
MSELAAKTSSMQRTRIGKRFEELARAGEMGLVAYVTAGDPSLAATEEIVLAAAAAAADVIELGVPFSDPVADGPTVQRASERALRTGTTLAKVIDLVSRLRSKTDVPIVLFGYFNPILQFGLDAFGARAAAAGADGVLVTDMTPEESAEYRATMQRHGLDTVFLAAPTSTDARLKKIAQATSGFLYVIARAGVTGEKDSLPEELPAMIRRTRALTKMPLAVGFGISLPTQVTVLGGIADAVVVGSALVAEIEKASSASGAAAAVAERIRVLKHAARHGVSRRDPRA